MTAASGTSRAVPCFVCSALFLAFKSPSSQQQAAKVRHYHDMCSFCNARGNTTLPVLETKPRKQATSSYRWQPLNAMHALADKSCSPRAPTWVHQPSLEIPAQIKQGASLCCCWMDVMTPTICVISGRSASPVFIQAIGKATAASLLAWNYFSSSLR